MTDKEVRKLKRPELLEILFYLQKEIETLKEENERLHQQLEALAAKNALSDEDIEKITDAVKIAVKEASSIKTNVRRIDQTHE